MIIAIVVPLSYLFEITYEKQILVSTQSILVTILTRVQNGSPGSYRWRHRPRFVISGVFIEENGESRSRTRSHRFDSSTFVVTVNGAGGVVICEGNENNGCRKNKKTVS